MADGVEKVASWFLQSARDEIDLSDRPTNRSRVPGKGKKTPENLPTETDSNFFNSIGHFEAGVAPSYFIEGMLPCV
ncbi:hypothetical protein [Paraburkholderia fungorum]|uniref:Uncharacterized protein n=1 Tax=Paraburkholderia fungorum TaxID=134537 RepID=A0AAW3V5E7_9BURK|nr:hypothetical protein [Paraburkholderia fungorum]MBB4516018.1 hypothetical protein [Paraburkholderia fungorum]MBB6204877.1 hypothetical protein [Paraburkholderia fungorum]